MQVCFWPQKAHLRWTNDRSELNREEFLSCLVRANETYSAAKRQFSVRSSDAVMFVGMPSPLICGDPLLSLLCSARFRHCLSLWVGVVDWCTSLLVRLICCQIIFTASSTGRLFISRPLAIRRLVLPPSPSGRERLGVPC